MLVQNLRTRDGYEIPSSFALPVAPNPYSVSHSPDIRSHPTPPPTVLPPAPASLTMQSRQVVEPQKSDYPDVPYWHRHEWAGRLKKSKGITDPGKDTGQHEGGSDDGGDEAGDEGEGQESDSRNPSMPYLTDEKGVFIEQWRATVIRNIAAECWMELLEHKDMKAPRRWSKVKPAARQYYIQKLEEKCPEVRLCANNWKANDIATRHYPNFYRKNEVAILAQWPPGHIEASSFGKKRTHSTIKNKSIEGQKRPRLSYITLPNPL